MEEIKITDEQREQIKKIQIEMLKEVDRICEGKDRICTV